jgi:glycosyltransferase involved in cell wall biosynthesis
MTALSANQAPAHPELPPNGRLKVCLASWAPFLAGAEIAAERLALGLQEAGHEVFVVLGNQGPTLERMVRAGLRCLYSPICFTDKWHWWRYWRARKGLRRLLRQERPDVIHSNDLPTHQIVSDAARGLNIPRITHHRFPFGGDALDWLNKYGAEHHLFVSQALMDENCGNSERLRSSSRSVVYDGLPLPALPTAEERQRTRTQLGLPRDETIVTIAGQVVERKGVADLIRAWMQLAPDVRAKARLVIVGDDLQNNGQYRVEMEKLAASLHCPAQFVGFQKNISDWLIASDIAVVPSHVEPLGNATLEAMSYALPVIGSNVGGIPEMIVHEQTGLLVLPCSPDQLAATITRLVTDKETRLRYGNQGRQRCEQLFSLQAHVRGVLEEYRRVLQRSKVRNRGLDL